MILRLLAIALVLGTASFALADSSCSDQNVMKEARAVATGQMILAGGASEGPTQMVRFESNSSTARGTKRTMIKTEFVRKVGMVERSVKVRVLCENDQIIAGGVQVLSTSQTTVFSRADQ